MELRYFIIFCLFSAGQCLENDRKITTKSFLSNEMKRGMSRTIPLSLRRRYSEYVEKDSSDEKTSESIDRSPTNHSPSPYSHAHGHSPYVQMVFKLASEAVEASDASQRISHQLSMNHGHGQNGAMAKVRLPLYKQSYPVLFQHGHVMHEVMDGLPYPYVPTMKARPSTILHGQRNSNSENYSAENSNLISHGLALAHGQRNGHQAPHY